MSRESDELLAFLQRHENKDGPVGQFVRSCLLVFERAEFMTRDELKASAQLGLLLDCFPVVTGDEKETDQ